MPRFVAIACLLAGCNADLPSLMCGPGTMRVGDQCLPIDPSYDAGSNDDDAGTMFEADAGTPPADYDAGSGWTTGGPSNPGCDEAAGECDAWEAELLSMLRAGCAVADDPGAAAVADVQTAHSAQVDRIMTDSPAGTVFEQLNARDIEYREAAALFSVTRTGAADVMERWRNGDSAPMLARCYTHVGVSFHTSASGASYTTVVFLVR
jgi:hypothetical protein